MHLYDAVKIFSAPQSVERSNKELSPVIQLSCSKCSGQSWPESHLLPSDHSINTQSDIRKQRGHSMFYKLTRAHSARVMPQMYRLVAVLQLGLAVIQIILLSITFKGIGQFRKRVCPARLPSAEKASLNRNSHTPGLDCQVEEAVDEGDLAYKKKLRQNAPKRQEKQQRHHIGLDGWKRGGKKRV
jgi:hypothetical protein